MARVVVTGGSGKAGRAIIRELVAHDEDVVSVDLVRTPGLPCAQIQADLTELGQAVEVLGGAEAVVHLAAIPAPGMRPDEVTFRTNTSSTYNVFSAAAVAGVSRVVWASSETVLGLPFGRQPPSYAPVDEQHPRRPESSYALSKLVGEELATQFSRWTGIPYVGLRFSYIHEPEDYAQLSACWEDPHLRSWNLWSYVDAHDVGQACRRALSSDLREAEVFIVAAGDTIMNRPTRDLMAEVFPDVPLGHVSGRFGTLLSSGKAHSLLGYEPQFSWRDHLEA